jgi:hypothetical protein
MVVLSDAPRSSGGVLLCALTLFFGVGEGGFAHPGSLVMGFDAGCEALAVARAVAVHDTPEFFPVDVAVVVMATRLVPFEVRVGQRDAEHLGLIDGGIDELLAQVVIGNAD